MSDNAENNQEDFAISLEEFASGNLPSLDDLLLELEQIELQEIAATTTAARAVNFADNDAELIQAHSEISRLRQENNELRTENSELQTAYTRVRHDLEKHRWRVERERGEHYTFAVMSVVRELLPVLDNFSRAVVTARDSKIRTEAEFVQFLSGVDLINQQIHKFLADMGVQPIEAVGVEFDPQIHEAAALEADDKLPANTIIAEILRGYRLGQRLIRPSLVKVSTNEVIGN